MDTPLDRGSQGTFRADYAIGRCGPGFPLAASGELSAHAAAMLTFAPMMTCKTALAVLALSSLGISVVAVPMAQAEVVIIHAGRDEPPPAREERVVVHRGYVWDSGHYGWRHRRYVWTRGRYVRERRGYGWVPGRWQRHDDHYDWYAGSWHPSR